MWSSWKPWQHHKRAAQPISIDPRGPTKPRVRSAEDVVELGESALATLMDEFMTKLQNRELLIEMLESCAAEYHVPYPVFLKLRKQFELPSLSREMRNLAETLQIFASIREKSTR